MTQTELDEVLKLHKKWLNDEEGGERADLRWADLDFSTWPLWCGSLGVVVDKRLFCQLAYHLCRVVVDDEECKAAQLALGKLANQFHRVEDCGRVEEAT